MRRLHNTLYILNPKYTLGRDGENVVVRLDGKEVGRRPITYLEQIVCFNYTGMNGALLRLCAEHGVTVSFLSEHGSFLGSFYGPVRGNVLLRREQYRIADCSERSLLIAKNMIAAKIINSRKILQRAIRDNGDTIDRPSLELISEKLFVSADNVFQANHSDLLRGIEGDAAKAYFSVLDKLILKQKEDFHFQERNRRPPCDYVNALLSFAYTLLANECKSALETVGLDPCVGFFHTDKPGRPSLALDLMEELRAYRADRFVLSMINLKQISAKDFEQKENGSILLTDEGRAKFVTQWHTRNIQKIKHPFLQEEIEVGLLPFAQAMLLSRYIREDIDSYPPFFIQ